MDRTQQRCLVGSTAAHGGLLLLVLLLSTMAARKAIQPDVPFLEIIPTDFNLTMGNQIGGGNPNPQPPAARDGTPPVPTPAVPAPTPAPTAPPVQAKTVETPKPVPVVRKTEPAEPAEPRTERKIDVSKETRTPAKAQDTNPARKAEKTETSPPSKIQVSTQTRTRSAADRQREAKEAQEAREAAAAADARDRRLAAAQKLASRVGGAAAGVSKNVGGSTKIDMPGPGGTAYFPYLTWLEKFLYDQWRRPSTNSQGKDEVLMEIVIARDGTVLSAVIKKSSGSRSFDASAEEVFRRNRILRPLPDDYTEPRLVVPVKFVLEASG